MAQLNKNLYLSLDSCLWWIWKVLFYECNCFSSKSIKPKSGILINYKPVCHMIMVNTVFSWFEASVFFFNRILFRWDILYICSYPNLQICPGTAILHLGFHLLQGQTFFFNLSTAYMLEILAFLVKMYYLMRKRLLLCSYWYFVKFAGWMGFCHEDECRSAGSFSVRGIFVL